MRRDDQAGLQSGSTYFFFFFLLFSLFKEEEASCRLYGLLILLHPTTLLYCIYAVCSTLGSFNIVIQDFRLHLFSRLQAVFVVLLLLLLYLRSTLSGPSYVGPIRNKIDTKRAHRPVIMYKQTRKVLNGGGGISSSSSPLAVHNDNFLFPRPTWIISTRLVHRKDIIVPLLWIGNCIAGVPSKKQRCIDAAFEWIVIDERRRSFYTHTHKKKEKIPSSSLSPLSLSHTLTFSSLRVWFMQPSS